MKNYQLNIKPLGAKALLVEWPAKMENAILKDIFAFKNTLNDAEIVDVITAYNSVTIVYKNPIKNFLDYKNQLLEFYKNRQNFEFTTVKTWKIPVCYDAVFGVDLMLFAKVKSASVAQIIHMHSTAKYQLAFYGFQPGFPYLSNLNPKLHQPRKAKPTRVAKNSVAIGGSQTGIYPADSLGGWHVIGKTPIDFFNIANNPPCFVNVGDIITFHPITIDEFYAIQQQVQRTNFKFQQLSND